MPQTTHKKYAKGLMWFRRDLRLADNAALYHALKTCDQVVCAFVFDTDILAGLPQIDRRVVFIHESLQALDHALQATQPANPPRLLTVHGPANPSIAKLATALGVQAVFTNRDDEPQAVQRDAQTLGDLAHAGIMLHTFKDQCIFERSEVLTQAERPFSVFTPYKNAWLKKLEPYYLKAYPSHSPNLTAGLLPANSLPASAQAHARIVPLQDMGFEWMDLPAQHITPGSAGAHNLLQDFVERMTRYKDTRDFPAVKGPSYLSVHLRFGTVSIRELARLAFAQHATGDVGASTWLSELIWRDFYMQVMHHHPRVVGHAFKPEYDKIEWEKGTHAKTLFKAWCDGQTGYPLVDAAMHQLNQTGYMHNRLRMVVASFLSKDLGLDWRWGEAYFAEKLIDFDLSANNGGWQWASSSGCDAQPYFRIFNPISQSEKFDTKGKFIRRYLPQLADLSDKAIHAPWLAAPLELAGAGITLGDTYPLPIVDHAQARAKTLARYAVVKKEV
ncbi:MAG: DNA photolyase family protein [Burkholderiaceae bacterium]|nr:DNA photolyase family protein [Burkholderiaceae bacterium]